MLHVHHTQTHTWEHLLQNVRAQPTSKSGLASVKFQEDSPIFAEWQLRLHYTQQHGGMWRMHISVCNTEQPSQWSTKDTQTAKDTQSVARRSTCKKGVLIHGKKAEQQIRLALLEPCREVNQAQVWFTQRSGCLSKLGREETWGWIKGCRKSVFLCHVHFIPFSLETSEVKMAIMLSAPSLTHISLHPMIQPERESITTLQRTTNVVIL